MRKDAGNRENLLGSEPNLSTTQSSTRIGVPGHKAYSYDSTSFGYWKGSSFQAALQSPVFKFHIICFAVLCGILSSVKYNDFLRALSIPDSFKSTLSSMSIFFLTFFLSNVFGKWNTRFDTVCQTNGNLAQLIALCGSGTFSRPDAEVILRYANSIVHLQYLLVGGMMKTHGECYQLMQQRGLLNAAEVQQLQRASTPSMVLHSWAIDVVRCSVPDPGTHGPENPKFHYMGPGKVNGVFDQLQSLGEKQLAHKRTQVPFIYFHAVTFAVNSFLCCTHYDTSHEIARFLNDGCDGVKHSPDAPEPCVQQVVLILLVHLWLIFLVLTLLLASYQLAECYGTKPHQYDLGFDLDRMWAESKAALEGVGLQRPLVGGGDAQPAWDRSGDSYANLPDTYVTRNTAGNAQYLLEMNERQTQ
jgi:hypothetical protein